MIEKEPNATEATHSETNQRGFLKTGAAFAGAAMLGQAFNAVSASAAKENPQDLKAFIMKPFVIVDLAATVRKVLDNGPERIPE